MPTLRQSSITLAILLIALFFRFTFYTDLVRPAEFKVFVAGHVVAPGLYTVSSDTRLHELLIKAGGVDHMADLTAINLAAKVRSRWIWVPGK